MHWPQSVKPAMRKVLENEPKHFDELVDGVLQHLGFPLNDANRAEADVKVTKAIDGVEFVILKERPHRGKIALARPRD